MHADEGRRKRGGRHTRDYSELALIAARREAISDLRDATPKKYRKLTIEQIDQTASAQAEIAGFMDKLVKTEAGQASKDIERAVSVGMTIDGDAVTVVKGGRSSTKVVGVLPTDVNAAAIEAHVGTAAPGVTPHPKEQGLNFATTDVGMSSKDLIDLAGEIAARASAGTP